jgi:lipopolysaccharide/colanic/teichoic acid biosynthesis glycosyltransferase
MTTSGFRPMHLPIDTAHARECAEPPDVAGWGVGALGSPAPPASTRSPASSCPVLSESPPVSVRGRLPAWEEQAGSALDVVGASLALLVLAPLFLLVAMWVRLDSPGPALFRQARVGLGGQPFTLYKFRTMRTHSDDRAHRALIMAELSGASTISQGSTKLLDDTRVTRAGRFLRRTSLDELPQLINVLSRRMSLVGPRPCLPWEVDLFPAEFKDRFTVRPGITGLWQVRGRSTLGTLDMLRLDLQYVRSRRLLSDVVIILATVPSMLRGDGAR